jgi:hypothetical protein
MMRAFSICSRTSLSVVALACLSGIASAQEMGYPADTPRSERTVQGRFPSAEGHVPDPGRPRSRRRDTMGGYEVPSRQQPIAWPAERKLTDAKKRMLYPSAKEKASFASLLREDGTGMTRLLPFFDADPRVLDIKGTCLDGMPQIPGRGMFYSFKSENHEARAYSDLTLNSNEFRVGFANNAVGTITTLGDVPLDNLTLQSSAVAPLLLLAPAKTFDEMVTIYERSRALLASGHHAYGTASPAQPNMTYVMRSTTYKPNGRKHSDVIVAFRVTRQDADGSVTILWKHLRTPKG